MRMFSVLLAVSCLLSAAFADSLNCRQVGYCDTPGWACGVAVSGDYAYVADDDAGLRIINVSNPQSPSEAGYYDTPGDACDVAVPGDYAYVADLFSGLRIIEYYGAGVEESPKPQAPSRKPTATIVRGVLQMAKGERRRATGVLLNAAGCKVLDLHSGANDVSMLAPGVYFIHPSVAPRQSQASRVVVIE